MLEIHSFHCVSLEMGDKILDFVRCLCCFYNENNNFSILGKKLQYLLEPYHVTESNTLT